MGIMPTHLIIAIALYGIPAIITALATCIIMRGGDWDARSAYGAGLCWPILLFVFILDKISRSISCNSRYNWQCKNLCFKETDGLPR